MTQPSAHAKHAVDMVVFDLGGVVVRICKTFEQAAARAGLTFDPGVIDVPDAHDRRKQLHAKYEMGKLVCGDFFAGIASTTAGLYSPDQFRAIHESWIIDEYEGIHELIDDLHAAGVRTGALSNTNATHWGQMSCSDDPAAKRKFTAPAKLQHRHASHLLGCSKPDQAIYRAFIEQTHADPRRTVFFDDLEANVLAARAAGWHAHQIDPTGDPPGQIRRLLAMHHFLTLKPAHA